MTSYKKTTKFKYTKNPSDVVVLREYILFEDSAQGSKSALLKFCNNLDQKLFGVQFEVYQYDEADSLIAKSLVVYDKFTAEANAEFVPKAKLKLSENCASISVKLISADFDRIRWEKGSFTDTGYEFKRYVAEANKTPAPRGEQPAPAAFAAPPEKKRKKSRKTIAFQMREVRAKNMAKFPLAFNILAAVLVIAFCIGTAIWFRQTSPRETIDGYDVKISGDTVAIFGYEGYETNLVIPESIGGKRVTEIGRGAFTRVSGVKSVTFSSDVTVRAGAFENCANLERVQSEHAATVSDGAFSSCENLRFVDMPLATVSKGGFYGSYSVSRLNVKVCEVTRLFEVFGKGGMNLEFNAAFPSGRITSEYFDNVTITDLCPKSAYKADFAALVNVEKINGVHRLGYEYFDNLEVKAGEVQDVRPNCSELTIPSAVKIFDTAKFASLLSGVRKLVIDTDMKISEEFFSAFHNLEELELKNSASAYYGVLKNCAATRLVMPAPSASLFDIIKDANVRSVAIVSGAISSDNYNCLEGVTLDSLEISPSVAVSGYISFKYADIAKLSLPILRDGALSELYAGISEMESLRALELKSGKHNAISASALSGLQFIASLYIECDTVAAGAFAGFEHFDTLSLKLGKYGDSFSELFSESENGVKIERLIIDTNKVKRTYFDDCGDRNIQYTLVQGEK